MENPADSSSLASTRARIKPNNIEPWLICVSKLQTRFWLSFSTNVPNRPRLKQCNGAFHVSQLFPSLSNVLRAFRSYSTFPYRMKRSRSRGEKWSNGFQRQFSHASPTSQWLPRPRAGFLFVLFRPRPRPYFSVSILPRRHGDSFSTVKRVDTAGAGEGWSRFQNAIPAIRR